MSESHTLKRGWFEWALLPVKVFVLLALPLVLFADSPRMPWLASLDMGLDMLVGWLCILCSLVFVVASLVQGLVGPAGAARRCFWFALLAFIVGGILSPLFSRA